MPTNTYTALATITLGSPDTEVVFASIPSTARDLVLVIQGTSSAITNWRVRFNGDTGSNYNFVAMAGTGGGSGASGAFSNEVFSTIVWQNYGAVTSLTQSVLQIMDYSATDKHKTFLARTDNSSGATEAFANRWANNSAIYSISLFAQGTTWAIGSTFSLYGIAS